MLVNFDFSEKSVPSNANRTKTECLDICLDAQSAL